MSATSAGNGAAFALSAKIPAALRVKSKAMPMPPLAYAPIA